jgi:2-iminobutanoate/2-iminopropanoate deaminase
MTRKILRPDTVHKPTTVYSHAMVIGDTIYTAGQAPHNLAGEVWPPSDPEGQVRRVFDNLGLVLEAAGVGFDAIDRMSVFVRTPEVLSHVWAIAPHYLGGNQPAITMAVVDGLAGPEYLLEVDAIAHR